MPVQRLDPHPAHRFLLYFAPSMAPVAAARWITGLSHATDIAVCRDGGDPIAHTAPARTKFNPINLERGVTQDPTFAN